MFVVFLFQSQTRVPRSYLISRNYTFLLRFTSHIWRKHVLACYDLIGTKCSLNMIVLVMYNFICNLQLTIFSAKCVTNEQRLWLVTNWDIYMLFFLLFVYKFVNFYILVIVIEEIDHTNMLHQ